MDTRYLLLAAAVIVAGGAWQYFRHSNSALVWTIPFAVILVFLAMIGEPPSKRVMHWSSDPVED